MVVSGLQVALQDERLHRTDAKARLFERGGYRALEKVWWTRYRPLLILKTGWKGSTAHKPLTFLPYCVPTGLAYALRAVEYLTLTESSLPQSPA